LVRGDTFLYVYDFGDDRVSHIAVEKSLPAEDGIFIPDTWLTTSQALRKTSTESGNIRLS
jgi:hypothetical protein